MEEGRGGYGGAAVAASAPETDEVVIFVEGIVEVPVGDFSLSPFRDLGLGTPPSVA